MPDVIAEVQTLFKNQYAKEAVKPIPENAIIRNMCGELIAREGSSYKMPVVVTRENGFTYNLPNAGNPVLNSARGMSVKTATIQGYNQILKMVLNREDMERGNSDMKSVEDVLDLITANGMDSFHNRLEISYHYGQKPIGKPTTASAGTGADNIWIEFPSSGAGWSLGVWSASEQMLVSFPAVVGATGAFTVEAVNIESKKVRVKETVGGQAVTLLAHFPLATDVYLSEAYGKDMFGIDYQIEREGDLFGIDTSLYSMYNGNVYPVGGTLTRKKIIQGLRSAVGKGLRGQEVKILLSPATWVNLADAESEKRMYDSSYAKTLENGAEEIKFRGDTGIISLVCDPMVKEDEAFAIPTGSLVRVGAQEPRFEPLAGEGNYLKSLEGYDGYEMRVTTTQAILVQNLAKATKFIGITN